jgi:hypothetical protein
MSKKSKKKKVSGNRCGGLPNDVVFATPDDSRASVTATPKEPKKTDPTQRSPAITEDDGLSEAGSIVTSPEEKLHSSVSNTNWVLVDLTPEHDDAGWVEIVFSFCFGLFIGTINLVQKYIELRQNGKSYDAISTPTWELNLILFVGVFLLTTDYLLFLSQESSKISLYIKRVTRFVSFYYLAALAGIVIVAHFDSFLKDEHLTLNFGHTMIFFVSIVQWVIAITTVHCFEQNKDHYPEHVESHKKIAKWSKWLLWGNCSVTLAMWLAKIGINLIIHYNIFTVALVIIAEIFTLYKARKEIASHKVSVVSRVINGG